MNTKPITNIALIAGGYSKESEVSFKSAKAIMKEIDRNMYNVFYIEILKDSWVCKHNNQEYPVDRNTFTVIIDEVKHSFSLAFIMIHGTPGENGLLQGYFDMLNIPYTTCSAIVSSVTFSKYFCNMIVKSFDIVNVAKSMSLEKSTCTNFEEVSKQIGYPCFVKPNAGGSSIGVSKVTSEDMLPDAIKKAFAEDAEVLVEQFMSGTEVTCGVIKNCDVIRAFPLTEIVPKNRDFFDYEAKYKGMSDEITPARISQEQTAHIQDVSKILYEKLRCKGLVRFDYMLSEDNKLWFIEVNTVPGMSDASIVPQQANSIGMSYRELVNLIIEAGLENR